MLKILDTTTVGKYATTKNNDTEYCCYWNNIIFINAERAYGAYRRGTFAELLLFQIFV